MKPTDRTSPDKPHAVYEAEYVRYIVLQTHKKQVEEKGDIHATWTCYVVDEPGKPEQSESTEEVFITDILQDPYLKLTRASRTWVYTYGIPNGSSPEIWEDVPPNNEERKRA